MKKQNKKRKILIGIGILILALALGAWFFLSQHQNWMSLEEDLDGSVTWQEDGTIRWEEPSGMFEMIYHTEEPLAYAWNQRIVLRDGVRIRNERPYLSMRDALILDETVATIVEADTSDPIAVIVNGLYGQGTEEQNAMIRGLLGGEYARERFELYFQWYNSIHELAHVITVHNGTYDPQNMGLRHMVDEEILANSFAVAFWMYYGEDGKLDALEEMVEYVLSNITPPVDDMSHLDFMREGVDGERYVPFTFEVYGWFQFSLVRDILHERDSLDLASLLTEMTGGNVQAQPRQVFIYETLGTDMVPIILADAISILRDWGVDFPDVYVSFSTDPNMHAMQYPTFRALLEPNIAAGRVIPAFR